MATVAILIIDVTAGGLARSQSQLGIASAPLDFASGAEREQKDASESLCRHIRAVGLSRLPLKRENLSHQNGKRINSVIPHHKPIPSTWPYQQGLCAIFTNGNSTLIVMANQEPCRNPRKIAIDATFASFGVSGCTNCAAHPCEPAALD
jgi:hypothetical protein